MQNILTTDAYKYSDMIIAFKKDNLGNKMLDIKHEHLHTAIRNGIPPAMTHKLHGCLWADGPPKADIKHINTEEALGYMLKTVPMRS